MLSEDSRSAMSKALVGVGAVGVQDDRPLALTRGSPNRWAPSMRRKPASTSPAGSTV